jgi:hypothetical protein
LRSAATPKSAIVAKKKQKLSRKDAEPQRYRKEKLKEKLCVKNIFC